MADLDLARIKRNVAKMAAQNAPEADIDGYIASEGTTVDAVRAFRPGAAQPQTQPEEQAPQFGGATMNATAGANETLYGALGAPVDIMRGGINLGIRGINAATGSDIGQIPEDSFGGSRFIAESLGSLSPELDPRNTQATTMGDRIARGVGQGAAGTILPAAAVSAAGRAGVIGPQAAEMGAQLLGRSNSVRNVGAEALTGAAAGAGAATAAEFTPEQYRTIGSFAGGLAGGGLGALATGIPGLVREGVSLAGRYLEPLTQGGREQLAGRTLRDAATDPQAMREALDTAPRELVPGSQPTTFQLTGDMGVGGLERASQTRFPAEFNQRRADQNTARVGALEAIQPNGAPEKVAQSVRSYIDQLDNEAMDALSQARNGAAERNMALGASTYPDEAGASVRATIETSRASAKDRERAIWSAVDPDGTLTVLATGIRQQAQTILRDLPQSARQPQGEEAAIYDVLGRYGDVMPFSEVTALSSRLKAAMREERLANGESPDYRRMSQLNGAIQQNLDGTVTAKAQQEAQAVASGQMRAEDTFAANFLRAQEEWLAGRNAGQAANAAGATGGNRPVGFGANGPSGSRPVPGMAGAEGQAGGRLSNPSSDPRLSVDAEPNFDAAARERLNAANAATRERVQTFDNPTLAPIRRSSGGGAYQMPDGSIPARLFSQQPQSFDAIQTYRRAVGDQEALFTLGPYVVGQARKAALREDGTFDPQRLANWRRQHESALRAFPDLDARLGDAGRASESVGEMAALQRQQKDTLEKSALGRFLGTENPSEVTGTIGNLMSRQDGARQLAQIRQTIGNDAEALEGLRKAAADFITGRLIGNTEVGTSGQAGIRSDQYQTFMRQNGPALRAIFSEDEVRTMELVAADLQRAARSQNAVRIPGQSNTAQDTLAIQGDDSPVSVLAKIAGASVTTGGGAGMVGGPVAGTIAGVSTLLGAALRENGIRRVDELVRDALLNPDRARALLSGVRPSKPGRESEIARRYRASVLATGGMSWAGEESPNKSVLDLMQSAPMPASRLEQNPSGSLGPRASLDAPASQAHPQQALIDLLMQGTRDQNQGRVDRKTMAMAELLKRGGLSSQEPQDANKEGLNQAQRQFLAQRLLAG